VAGRVGPVPPGAGSTWEGCPRFWGDWGVIPEKGWEWDWAVIPERDWGVIPEWGWAVISEWCWAVIPEGHWGVIPEGHWGVIPEGGTAGWCAHSSRRRRESLLPRCLA